MAEIFYDDKMVVPLNGSTFVPYKRFQQQNITSYFKKRERREKHLKEILKEKVLSQSRAMEMMSALIQLTTDNSDIIDRTLLELWRQVMKVFLEVFSGMLYHLPDNPDYNDSERKLLC